MSGRFDLVALEDILLLLITGKVDDTTTVLLQGAGDGEQHGVSEAAAGKDDGLIARDLRWSAGWSHHHHRLAGLEMRAESRRAAHLQNDEGQQAALFVGPGAGQRDALHAQTGAVNLFRIALEVLQPEKLSRLELARGVRRAHHDFHDGRREAIHLVDARDERVVEHGHQLAPPLVALRLRLRGSFQRHQIAREQCGDVRKTVSG